jgi:hypothetical protein
MSSTPKEVVSTRKEVVSTLNDNISTPTVETKVANLEVSPPFERNNAEVITNSSLEEKMTGVVTNPTGGEEIFRDTAIAAL